MAWVLRRIAEIPLYAIIIVVWALWQPLGFWSWLGFAAFVFVVWAYYSTFIDFLSLKLRSLSSDWLKKDHLLSRATAVCRQMQEAVRQDDFQRVHGLFSDEVLETMPTLEPWVLKAFGGAEFVAESSLQTVSAESGGVKVTLHSQVRHSRDIRVEAALRFNYAGRGNRVTKFVLKAEPPASDATDSAEEGTSREANSAGDGQGSGGRSAEAPERPA